MSKIKPKNSSSETQELLIENHRKEYKLTTSVNAIDGVKGGSITGEGQEKYEVIKYGDSSEKQIKITPDENYEIISITVNGEEFEFEALDDGSFIMPQFENVIEDKKIIVTFALKDNKITINKIDSNTGEKLTNAKFKLDQIEERTNPNKSEIIGDLLGSSNTYNANYKNILQDFQVYNNGTYYFTKNSSGYLIPTNSKTYRGVSGVANTTANSYIPIDLTSLSGTYYVSVTYRKSTQSSYDIGYATITQNTTAPVYTNSTGRFIYTSGNSTSNYSASSQILNGGNKYYLHFGYRKNDSTDTGDDLIEIKSITLYKTNVSDKFIENNGKWESNIQGISGVQAWSYVPIDLRNYEGSYKITVNAEISSRNGYDYGFATINQTTSKVYYYTNNSTNKRFMYISGEQSAKDYSIEIEGGALYYLHFGYYKNSNISSGDDKLTINYVDVSLSENGLYHTTLETNSSGQAITQIPFGKYNLTEIEAPEGYELNNTPKEIEFRSTEGAQHEFTIENKKLGRLIVHHYIKDTETSLAEDEISIGKQGEEYTTTPKMDFADYELEQDENGDYIFPENNVGTYKFEDQVVTYYYVKKQLPLIVHHYIEGTLIPVPLSDGENAEDITNKGNEGTNYETKALTEEELNEKYELVEVPGNSSGIYEAPEIEVTYYYRIKKFNLTTSVKPFEEVDSLGQTQFVKGGTISGEELDTYEIVEYGEDSEKEIKVVPDYGFEIKSITINDEPIVFTPEPDGSVVLNKFVQMLENKNVEVSFQRTQGSVIVNHYIEGTGERITDLDGIEVAQEIKQGDIGSGYATKPREDLYAKYELVSSPAETSGEFKEEPVTLNYYYRIKKYPYIVNYLLKDDDEDDTNNTVLHEQKADGETYDYGTIINAENEKLDIGGYKVDSITVECLKITEENNVLNIYYTIDNDQTKDIKYTVEFYKGDEKQELDTLEEEKTVQVLSTEELEVNKDNINIINKYTGYILDKLMLNDEEIAEIPDTVENNDIITVYYKKDNFMYTVEYYFDDVIDDDLTEIDIADYGEIITEYTDKVKEGYRLKEEVLPLQITEDIDTNIMKVYYVTDDSQTKDLSYKVEYYKEEELQVSDTTLKTITVQVLQPDTIEVNKDEINTNDKYEYYNFKKIMVNDTEVAELPDTVNDNDVIKVYYDKKSSQIIVKYKDLDGNTIKGDYLIEGKVFEEFDISTLNDEIPGYTLKEKSKEGIIKFEVEQQEIVFTYEKVAKPEKKDAKIIVKYLEINTNIEIAPKEVIEGKEGDTYKTEEKILEKYSFLKIEGTSEGTMEKGEKEVIYYYTMIRVDQGVPEHRVDLIGKTEKEIQKETKKEVIPKVSANKPVTNNTKKQNKTSETKKLETGDVLPVAVFSIVIVLIISNTLIAIVTKEENGSRNSNKQISTRRKTLIKTKDKIKRTSRMERLSNVEPEKKVKKGRRAK